MDTAQWAERKIRLGDVHPEPPADDAMRALIAAYASHNPDLHPLEVWALLANDGHDVMQGEVWGMLGCGL